MERQLFNQERMPVRDDERRRASIRPTRIKGVSERIGTERTANILMFDISDSTREPISATDYRSKNVGIKDAGSTFIANSPEPAFIGAITFGTRADILFDMQQRGSDPVEKMINKIQGLHPDGFTAMCEAYQIAGDMISRMKHLDVDVFRIFTMTDGASTDGNPVPITDDLKRKYPNVQIHSIGFGRPEQMKLDVLRQIASVSESGQPFYYHVEDAVKLTGILKRQSRLRSL